MLRNKPTPLTRPVGLHRTASSPGSLASPANRACAAAVASAAGAGSAPTVGAAATARVETTEVPAAAEEMAGVAGTEASAAPEAEVETDAMMEEEDGARRRRRLTLAPRPQTRSGDSKVRGKHSEVRVQVFASSEASSAEEKIELDSGRRSSTGSNAPCADPLEGFSKGVFGSRFWALADESSSDEEEVEECRKEGARDLAGVEQKLPTKGADGEGKLAPAGSSEKGLSAWEDDAKRVKTTKCRSLPAISPWRGPVPKNCMSPNWSLGDIWVKDLRSSGRRSTRVQLSKIADQDRSLVGGARTTRWQSRSHTEGNFEFQKESKQARSFGPCRPKGRTVIKLQAGWQKLFRGTSGLNVLLNGGGKPRGFRSSHAPDIEDRGKPLKAMAAREANGSGSAPVHFFGEGRKEGQASTEGNREMQGRVAGRGYGEDHRRVERGRGYIPGYERNNSWGPRFGLGARGRARGFGTARGNYGRFGGQEHVQEGNRRNLMQERGEWKERDQKQGRMEVGAGDTKMEEAGVEGDEEDEVKAGIKCGRCAKKGHISAKCTTALYCVICDGHDHVNHKCPVLKMPRPVAHAVGYAVHGLGFYHIPRPPLARNKKETRKALITVEGGELTPEQIVSQLQRICPVKWKWELEEHEVNAFVTTFPSKIELQRSIAFGGADVREAGIAEGVRLKFEAWHDKEEGFLLPKVWIRVFGIRKELREFLDLWAIGSLMGSTQTVDMETTRKNEFGRIFVAVLNPNLIPPNLDVVIGDHYFELEFEVEKKGVDENGEEMEVDWSKDVADGESEQEEEVERGKQEKDCNREAKRFKDNSHLVNKEGKKVQMGVSAFKEKILNMSEEEFLVFLKKKAEEVLDISVEKVLGEVADKVLTEKDSEDDEEASRKMKESDSRIEGTEMEVDGGKELEAAAAIPEAIVSPIRSSPRLVRSSDENTLDKATRRAAAKALDSSEGDLQGNLLV